MPLKLVHIITHPIAYNVPVFRRLAADASLEFQVWFGTRHGVEASFDPGLGKTVRYAAGLTDGYQHEFLTPAGGSIGAGDWATLDALDLPDRLTAAQPDVVWLNGWATAMNRRAMAWCRAAGVPYLLRGDTNSQVPWWRWLYRRWRCGAIVRGASGCLAVGRRNADFYAGMGVPPERIYLVPYSIDETRFSSPFPQDVEKARAARPNSGLVAVSVGKLVRRKRNHDLLAAAAICPAVTVWLVGSGSEEAALRAQAERDLPGRVRFWGFQPEEVLPALLAAADLLVLASDEEPWGFVVQEAMAAGLPVLASDRVGAAADLVRDGTTGASFPVGDVSALARLLGEAATDPDRRRRMGGQAKDLVLRDYSAGNAAKGIAAAAAAVCERTHP